MASLVDQIFEQSKLGTAVNPDSNPFALGVQLGQGQQRVNISKQELAMELAQLPLKQTLMSQTTQMNALKLQDALETRDLMLKNEGNLREAYNLVGQALASDNPEDAPGYVMDIMSRTLGASRDARFQQLFKDTTDNAAIKARVQEMKNATRASSFMPSMGVATDPLTGEQKTFFMSSPNSAQLVKDPAAEHTAVTTNFHTLQDLQKAYNDAQAGGDPASIAAAKNALDTFTAMATPATETTTINPVTGEVTITKGRQMGDLTMQQQSATQQALANSLQTIDLAERLDPLISTETVGVEAFAKSWIKDRILAQRFPELASSQRATAESLAAQLRSSAIRSLRSDLNISEAERKQIMQSVPEINSPIGSPARAKQLIQSLRTMSAVHAVVSATKLNLPVPVPASRVLDADELKRLIKAGTITKEQAAAAYAVRIAQ